MVVATVNSRSFISMMEMTAKPPVAGNKKNVAGPLKYFVIFGELLKCC